MARDLDPPTRPTLCGKAATRLLLLSGFVALVALTGSAGQEWRAPTSTALSGDRAPRLELATDGVEVRLDGELVEGTARKLRRMLRLHPEVRLLSLTSEGGLVDEAEQVGDIVASLGLSTYVPDYCVSACTLVFVRGQERLVATAGRLGFHAPWEQGDDGGEIEVPSEEERRAYEAAGVAPDFAEEALRVPSTEMWFPKPERLIGARVATGFVEPAELGDRIARLPPTRRRWASSAAR